MIILVQKDPSKAETLTSPSPRPKRLFHHNHQHLQQQHQHQQFVRACSGQNNLQREGPATNYRATILDEQKRSNLLQQQQQQQQQQQHQSRTNLTQECSTFNNNDFNYLNYCQATSGPRK
jgi:hypothetical protein